MKASTFGSLGAIEPSAKAAIQQTVRAFAQAQVRPRSQEFESAGGYPERSSASPKIYRDVRA